MIFVTDMRSVYNKSEIVETCSALTAEASQKRCQSHAWDLSTLILPNHFCKWICFTLSVDIWNLFGRYLSPCRWLIVIFLVEIFHLVGRYLWIFEYLVGRYFSSQKPKCHLPIAWVLYLGRNLQWLVVTVREIELWGW